MNQLFFMIIFQSGSAANGPPNYSAKSLLNTTRFRFFKRSNSSSLGLSPSRPVMETDCEFQEGTFKEFYSWLEGDEICAGKLARFAKEYYWCYADYKYMSELFKDFPDFLTAVDWGVFGFEGRDGRQSTIWVGSEGAFTPCHMDTYGCNLVAQLYGKKKWTLFAPDEQAKLYPTRIPYEESSVFSQVNITCPDLETYPDISKAEKYEVILNPGDVLFVPKHWWHFVECIETSISVNSWIELESDCLDRVQEAITRILVCSLKSAEGTPDSLWLNPTEEVGTFQQNCNYLNNALSEVDKYFSSKCSQESPEQNSNDLLHVGSCFGTDDQEAKMRTESVTNTLVNCLTVTPVIEMISEQIVQRWRKNKKDSIVSSHTNQEHLQEYKQSRVSSGSDPRLVPSLKRKQATDEC